MLFDHFLMSGRLKFRRQSSVAARSAHKNQGRTSLCAILFYLKPGSGFAVVALLANFRPDPTNKDLI